VWSKVRRTARNRLVRRLGVPEILPALERLRTNGFAPEQISVSGLIVVNFPSYAGADGGVLN
jgi:hypothetical protein